MWHFAALFAKAAYQLCNLLPAFVNNSTFAEIEAIGKMYENLLPEGGIVGLQTEYMRWKNYWLRQPTSVKRPDCVLHALRVATDLGTYPALCTLLHIFATLPVTKATGERSSISALKYIKNYLRSTMTEDILNGLAHLYINIDIELDYNEVIDEFGKNKSSLVFRLTQQHRIRLS